MAKFSCFSIAFFFLLALVFAIEVSHVTALEASAATYRPNVMRRATTGVRRHHIKSHACFSATSVAINACVFLLALMDTKKNVHAITTGRPKKANLSVHEHSKQHIKYGDPEYGHRVWAQDDKNQGTFSMDEGLLGVVCGSMSLVNQSSPQTGGAFSYCLATWDSRSPGWLAFGCGAIPAD
ncbi:hypothetical protein Ddye_019157 [Dipteronia dyeriana]|uniref:Xylanase inhibitor N-terminal domain-containing protein n=1 Tax=Dipteronia dyeriana TaxID=168575 RepID=A0AAD9TXS6_9ROSI|nr:hypothetical protein Ddye_019157 [Dipteronia dyeriana]